MHHLISKIHQLAATEPDSHRQKAPYHLYAYQLVSLIDEPEFSTYVGETGKSVNERYGEHADGSRACSPTTSMKSKAVPTATTGNLRSSAETNRRPAMPNGGYPLWFGIPLTQQYALRFASQDMWLVERQDGRWDDVHQIPAEAVAAMLYHLAYWGMPDHGTAFIRGGLGAEKIEPAFRSRWCLYDY